GTKVPINITTAIIDSSLFRSEEITNTVAKPAQDPAAGHRRTRPRYFEAKITTSALPPDLRTTCHDPTWKPQATAPKRHEPHRIARRNPVAKASERGELLGDCAVC